MRVRSLLLCLMLLIAFHITASVAVAQILSGPWVKEQDDRIEQIRKGNVRVIVLDAQGKAVGGAQVHLAMLRHDFSFGVRLDPARFATGQPEPLTVNEEKLWRVMSAAAIEEPAQWTMLEREKDQPDWQLSEVMLRWAHDRQLAVRWGEVVSTDMSRLPLWATQLPDADFALTLEDHVKQIASRVGSQVTAWDVLTQLGDHRYIQDRLGEAMIRRLVAHAQQQQPQLPRVLRFTNTLAGPRLTDMVQQITQLRDAQIPFTALAIDTKLGGTVAHVSLERSLEWIAGLGLPLSMVNLEVGGATPEAAAVNLETALRAFFSRPMVQGIWLGGMTADQVIDPSSALVDRQGFLTPSGELFEHMVGRLWWSDEIIQADELGNVRQRVFAGAYQINAVWPGGQAQCSTYIRPGKQTQLVVVQQLKQSVPADASKPGQAEVKPGVTP